MTLQEIFARARAVNREVVLQILLETIKEHEPTILDLNIAQLQAGKRSNNTKIAPQYSKATKARKKHQNRPTDKVTLYDEGDFYAGFLLEADGFPVFITSSDTKTGKLEERYGPLFGLTQESIRTLRTSGFKDSFVRKLKALFYI